MESADSRRVVDRGLIVLMARPNYSGEKRRKELEKQKKKQEKKQRKLENASGRSDEATESAEVAPSAASHEAVS